jgi:hypothetical protein
LPNYILQLVGLLLYISLKIYSFLSSTKNMGCSWPVVFLLFVRLQSILLKVNSFYMSFMFLLSVSNSCNLCVPKFHKFYVLKYLDSCDVYNHILSGKYNHTPFPAYCFYSLLFVSPQILKLYMSQAFFKKQ